jgi:hypothetical protein
LIVIGFSPKLIEKLPHQIIKRDQNNIIIVSNQGFFSRGLLETTAFKIVKEKGNSPTGSASVWAARD